MPPEQIGYVNALLDSHEGYGLMRTRNKTRGIVEFWVPPMVVEDFFRVMDALGEEIPIEWENRPA